MQGYSILNSKETKKLLERIKMQYGIKELKFDYSFMLNKDKLYAVSKDFDFNATGRGINNAGVYFARIIDGKIRLSIEGSQIIGEHAEKNIIEINSEQITKWVAGIDVEVKEEYDGFVLVKYKDDFFGSGKIADGRLLNFVPKERRIYNLSSGSRTGN